MPFDRPCLDPTEVVSTGPPLFSIGSNVALLCKFFRSNSYEPSKGEYFAESSYGSALARLRIGTRSFAKRGERSFHRWYPPNPQRVLYQVGLHTRARL